MSVSKGGRGGTIINMASICGLDPFPWGPFYCASKFGVVGFTRSFAEPELESELGIKFIIICPGFTDTKLLPTNMESACYGQNAKIVGEQAIDKYGIQTYVIINLNQPFLNSSIHNKTQNRRFHERISKF